MKKLALILAGVAAGASCARLMVWLTMKLRRNLVYKPGMLELLGPYEDYIANLDMVGWKWYGGYSKMVDPDRIVRLEQTNTVTLDEALRDSFSISTLVGSL